MTFFRILTIAALFASTIAAQILQAQITGVVNDARVVASNIATGVDCSAVSDRTGPRSPP